MSDKGGHSAALGLSVRQAALPTAGKVKAWTGDLSGLESGQGAHGYGRASWQYKAGHRACHPKSSLNSATHQSCLLERDLEVRIHVGPIPEGRSRESGLAQGLARCSGAPRWSREPLL